ncbi:MAG TPA: hypothetical protein VM076_21455 [Gemmatimonadaceae bacterium]|nr:hypothetical protein [Gemmatimonadaceae bacterium]
MRAFMYAALVVAVATPLQAQNEAILRQAFEGKVVTVKIDMPATQRGVDVYPLDQMPVNFREVAERLKDNSTSLKIGQQVMITKVLVNKNSHIEFQLGGGGYGTFGDNTSTSVSHASQGETKAEKALRDSIKHAPGPTKRKQFEKELASVRGERERENARADAEAKQAQSVIEANLRAKRAESGSRFNVRYRNGIPADALTPDGLMRALAQYVDFGPGSGAVSSGGASSGSQGQSFTSGGGSRPAPTAVRKGLLLDEVESLLGPAATASETKEGTLTVLKRAYRKDGQKISASFVNGVLIDFTISPL